VDRIRVLASHVIDRIAAGEVIERPASVIKELLENAADAGARAIHVDLEGGGLERICVSDDGCGMTAGDARLCLERHATSKLAQPEDLFAITTLGFRGEALSSIASVARLTLTSRRPEAAVGTRVSATAGEIGSVEEIGCPVGTTVDVRDLFFNVPARRRFLRAPATEQAHVVEAAIRVVIGWRKGGVVIKSGERRLVDLPEDSSESSRIRRALGRRVDVVYGFDHTHDGVRVSGYVTRPEVDRRDTRGLWFFVNGRFVRDRMLQRALMDGYRTMVERGRYPLAVVFVDVDPGAVDVNVHPQKLEVRFSAGNTVFRAVSAALTRVLASTPWHNSESRTAVPIAHVAAEPSSAHYFVSASGRQLPPGESSTQQSALWQERRGPFSSLVPIGQALGVYLVCEDSEGLVLIDQHAAHERVTFERLRGQAGQGPIDSQPLLFPDIIEVNEERGALLEAEGSAIARLGFEVEPVGPGRWAIRAIPLALAGAGAVRLVDDLLDEIESLEGASLTGVRDDALAGVLSRCACHASVRAGDQLSHAEIAALLTELDRVDFGANCPHGRPVYHRLTHAELARLFHR
jgi:DNA mismatch repair protein MutL